MKNVYILLPILILFTGCAYLSSTTTRTVGSNNQPVMTTTAHAWTLFDAQNNLTKFRNAVGATNGWADGTYASNVNESSSSTNLVQILNIISSLVATGALK